MEPPTWQYMCQTGAAEFPGRSCSEDRLEAIAGSQFRARARTQDGEVSRNPGRQDGHQCGSLSTGPDGSSATTATRPDRNRSGALRSDRPKQPRMSLRASVGSTRVTRLSVPTVDLTLPSGLVRAAGVRDHERVMGRFPKPALVRPRSRESWKDPVNSGYSVGLAAGPPGSPLSTQPAHRCGLPLSPNSGSSRMLTWASRRATIAGCFFCHRLA